MALGFSYFAEEYRFDNGGDYSFYESLERKDLRSIGTSLYILKPFKGNKYFLFRASFKLNGDYFLDHIPNADFLKISVSPLVGWKHSPTVSYAVGAALGYNFGRPTIYPLFSYNRYFNKRWGIESVLPVNIKLRFKPNEKNIFYTYAEVKGASYTIQLNDQQYGDAALHLRKSEVRFLLSYEREVHDWLWVGFEGGYRSNINFELSESNRRNSDVLVSNKFQGAPVFNLSLFIVPPRKMLK